MNATDTSEAQLRVLFVHGLESGPNGPKVGALQKAGFEVAAEFMHMSVMRLDRKNSVSRQLLRLREVRAMAALVAVGLGGPRWVVGQRVATLAAAGLWLGVRRKVLRAKAVAKSFDACVAIQKEAVARHRPDIIVGSSWGGAVTAELLLQGCHSGPALLLAPAIHRVAQAHGESPMRVVERLQQLSLRQRMVVVHDPSDATVPFEDSQDLCSAGSIELKSVDAGGHRLLDLLGDGRLANYVHEATR